MIGEQRPLVQLARPSDELVERDEHRRVDADRTVPHMLPVDEHQVPVVRVPGWHTCADALLQVAFTIVGVGRPFPRGGVHVVRARPAAGGGRWVEISPERIRGWLDGFYSRHDGATEEGLVLTGMNNGDTATLYPPPGLAEAKDVDTLLAGIIRPPRIAVLLARKGAVAAGVADGTTITVSKIERFYVQGRTAAGGSSQQRYARRRANQAQAATQRAADIAARIMLPHAPGVVADPHDAVRSLVCGGDRLMIEAILTDRRLSPLALLRHPHLLDSAEPRLAVLADAAVAARRIRVHLMP